MVSGSRNPQKSRYDGHVRADNLMEATQFSLSTKVDLDAVNVMASACLMGGDNLPAVLTGGTTGGGRPMRGEGRPAASRH